MDPTLRQIVSELFAVADSEFQLRKRVAELEKRNAELEKMVKDLTPAEEREN